MAGSHEVRGSIPLSSTINLMAGSETNRPFLFPLPSAAIRVRAVRRPLALAPQPRKYGIVRARTQGNASERIGAGHSTRRRRRAEPASEWDAPAAFAARTRCGTACATGSLRHARLRRRGPGGQQAHRARGLLRGRRLHVVRRGRPARRLQHRLPGRAATLRGLDVRVRGLHRLGRSLRCAGERRDRPAPRRVLHRGAHGPHAVLGRAHVQHLHHAQRAP